MCFYGGNLKVFFPPYKHREKQRISLVNGWKVQKKGSFKKPGTCHQWEGTAALVSKYVPMYIC